MRREEIRGLIIYTLLIAVGLIVGLTSIKTSMMNYGPQNMSGFLFIIVVLVTAYLVNAIGHELLHALGALIGGYKVVFVNILGLQFENNNSKTSVKFREFDGLTGETKIAPKKEKLNINPFVWCPIFGFAAEVAVCIVLISTVKKNPDMKASWLLVASVIYILVSSMLAFYDLIPLRLDSITDGYRMRLFVNPINLKAYNESLSIQNKQRNGEEIGDIPVYDEITEYTAELNMLALYDCLGKENYEKAENIINNLIEHKQKLGLSDSNRLIAQKLYLEILTRPLEDAKKLYEEICPIDVRRFIANDVSMESIRAYILIAGMIEGSQSEVVYTKSKIEKAKKRALESQIKVEEILVQKALDYVYNNHPKWEKEITE